MHLSMLVCALPAYSPCSSFAIPRIDVVRDSSASVDDQHLHLWCKQIAAICVQIYHTECSLGTLNGNGHPCLAVFCERSCFVAGIAPFRYHLPDEGVIIVS